MTVQMIGGVPVWGDPLDNAVEQILNCTGEASAAALMADHHLGYSVPIGGVLAYENKLSPAGVGYDIGCGNKAVRLDVPAAEVKAHLKPIMGRHLAHDLVWRRAQEQGAGRSSHVRRRSGLESACCPQAEEAGLRATWNCRQRQSLC